jgi:hypothetical protein
VAVSVLKTKGDAHVGDETHPYPYPNELTVFVHDSVFCIVVCGPGGPRETIMWGVEVGTPGVVILIFHLAESSLLDLKMGMRKEEMEVVGRDKPAYLKTGS